MTEPNTALREARRSLHYSQDEMARAIREAGNRNGEPNGCSKRLVQKWESGAVSAPHGIYARALEQVTGRPLALLGFGDASNAGQLPAPGGAVRLPDSPEHILSPVPPGFPVERLCGHWATCYEFHSGKYHADIAHVTAVSSSQIRAVNYPPEPRTDGRAHGFRNEIEARLVGRHLVGHWKNVSDTRYFGTLHLAVMPSEIVMDGIYTGLANDIEVSTERWRWVRLADAGELPEMTLRKPAMIYELVTQYSQHDSPLQLADIREDSNGAH